MATGMLLAVVRDVVMDVPRRAARPVADAVRRIRLDAHVNVDAVPWRPQLDVDQDASRAFGG